MHEGHKVYIYDIQYFALPFVYFVVKHILTYETAPKGNYYFDPYTQGVAIGLN